MSDSSNPGGETPNPTPAPIPMKENFLTQCRALIKTAKFTGVGAGILAGIFALVVATWYVTPKIGNIIQLPILTVRLFYVSIMTTYETSFKIWEKVSLWALKPDFTIDRHMEKIQFISSLMAGATTSLAALSFVALTVTSAICVMKMYRFHQGQQAA